MDILKRNLAPLTGAAWVEIDDVAKQALQVNLSARRLVDFAGPLGWEAGAINLGRLAPHDSQPLAGVRWGLRKVQPLAEVRVPASVNIWEMDNIGRGCADADLDTVEDAATKAGRCEENAIYNGWEEAGIQGIIPSSPHDKLTWPNSQSELLQSIRGAVVVLRDHGIGGPYALVMGDTAYRTLVASENCGLPVERETDEILQGGPTRWSPVVAGAVLLSLRGGDFRLTVGADFSVGYESQDGENAHLYLTESFTFEVLEPAAAVAFA